MEKMVKPAIRDLKPYQNGSHSEALLKRHKTALKLDSNEATVPPSPRVLAALIRHIQDGPLHWYPDVESAALCRTLARYTGLPRDHILTFNGSDHALETLTRCFLSFNDEVILFTPTYDHFRVYAQSCDAVIKGVPETGSFTLAQKIDSARTPRTKMIYLVNPNNPTGLTRSRQEIREALAKHADLVFVVDEAYYEFCGITVADMVPEFPQLVVTRSFSKAFGLAGLRCGYTLAQPDMNAQLSKIRVGKNINALAQIAAKAALEDLDHMRRYVEEVRAGKEWLLEQFNALGIEAQDTPINFMLVKVEDPQKVTAFLKKRHIYVRDRSNLDEMAGVLRVTVGDRFLMKRFWQVFEKTPREFLTRESERPKKAIQSSGTKNTVSASRT